MKKLRSFGNLTILKIQKYWHAESRITEILQNEEKSKISCSSFLFFLDCVFLDSYFYHSSPSLGSSKDSLVFFCSVSLPFT